MSIGLVLGLLLAGLSIIWERLMFTGPFDFSQSYRATGLFSAMHLGGASIDGFLALTLPFIAALFMVARGRLLQIGGLFVHAGAVRLSRDLQPSELFGICGNDCAGHRR
ncbi:hypothetical protein [Chromatium okenii]|uniref:Uncharacterized protein n=1 Tax=Chromatium okenii TaxID=61644 RepID=A0A2S7XQN3_9GAMM|nr:hypothetical protein [Chromatium okenii]PQJ96049.1 hypothetical protein CXB77_09455 [Chromatium okenii]